MELNETSLFGIAAIPEDLHGAKSSCFGDITVTIRAVSSSNSFSPSMESLFLLVFSVLPNEIAKACSARGFTAEAIGGFG